MVEENKDQEFRSKNKDETINYSIEEIKQNELMSKRPKNICTVLSYIKQLLILASTVAGCISISSFASSAVILAVIASFTVGMKTRARTAIIKKFKSISKKKRNKHEKTLLPAKTKLNSIEILISKSSIDVY